MLNDRGQNLRQYFMGLANQIKSDIPAHAITEPILNTLAESIHNAMSDCATLLTRDAIKSWLRNHLIKSDSSEMEALIAKISEARTSSIDEIRQTIEASINAKKTAFLASLNAQIDSLKPFYSANRSNWPVDKTEWVPALFKQVDGESRFVYGGVILSPTLTSTTSLSSWLSARSGLFSMSGGSRSSGSVFGSSSRSGIGGGGGGGGGDDNDPPSVFSRWSSPMFSTHSNNSNQMRQSNLFNFVRYKSRLEELFPSVDLRGRFREQLRDLVGLVNECRRDYGEGSSTSAFRLTSNETYERAKREYESQRERLREEWSRFYEIMWPRDELGRNYELHHIIPLEFGGPNNIRNIIPLRFSDHRQKGVGLHSTVLVPLRSVMQDLCSQALPEYNKKL